jgi:hypothetical protein
MARCPHWQNPEHVCRLSYIEPIRSECGGQAAADVEGRKRIPLWGTPWKHFWPSRVPVSELRPAAGFANPSFSALRESRLRIGRPLPGVYFPQHSSEGNRCRNHGTSHREHNDFWQAAPRVCRGNHDHSDIDPAWLGRRAANSSGVSTGDRTNLRGGFGEAT